MAETALEVQPKAGMNIRKEAWGHRCLRQTWGYTRKSWADPQIVTILAETSAANVEG